MAYDGYDCLRFRLDRMRHFLERGGQTRERELVLGEVVGRMGRV